MARQAGLSRARFALRFHAVVGRTPADYLARWRVSLAQTLLAAGQPLKAIAPAVGYGSSAALTRAFQRHTGQGPTAWLRETLDQPDTTPGHRAA
jgi:AraC-like DNA-binding protein